MKFRLLILLLFSVAVVPMLRAQADTICIPVARFSFQVVDTTEACQVRVTFTDESYARIMTGIDSLDSIGVAPCSNRFWFIDSTPSALPSTTHLLGTGDHTITLVAVFQNRSDTITTTFPVADFCHCYDTVRDTAIENQLPWQAIDTLLAYDFDTSLFIAGPGHPVCDTLREYHLKVWWNYHDTITYYNCEGGTPVEYDSLLIHGDTAMTLSYQGIHGEDSTICFTLTIVPGTDTSIYDTILENQLPWFFFDSLFTDSVADCLFTTVNTNGCDSTIHYKLHVFWNGDHCDTTLSYGNVVTPNGDGINDRFVIGGLLSNNCYKWNELSIFDRNGHRVYHRTNISSDEDWWDPAADRIPSGTYFYIFKAHGVVIRTQHQGVIEVLREK